MNRFEFYKSLYEIEIKKRTDLNDSLNIPLAIIVIIGAAIYSSIINFQYKEFNLNTCMFVILCGISGILLLVSIGYLINVFALSFRSDYNYRYLEYTDELEEYYMGLQNAYSNATNNQRDLPLLYFENYIMEKYVIYCGANNRINRTKSSYLNKGKEYLVGSLVFLIFAFIPFAINHFYYIK